MYEKMYHILFNAITDALDMMDRQDYQAAMSCLELACRDAEEIYILQGPELELIDTTPASVNRRLYKRKT